MTRTARRGRPLGAIARAVLQVVKQQPVTVTHLAAQLQLSRSAAEYTVTRLVTSGYASYGERVLGPHGRPAHLVTTAEPEVPLAMPWWPR